MQLKKKHKKYDLSTRPRCWYCGVRITKLNYSEDHQVLLSRNGSNKRSNKVLACIPCNGRKAAMDVETYRWWLKDQKALGEPVIFFGER